MKNRKLIFVDTEFSTLDPYEGEILSVGMVKEDGEDLYLELEYSGRVNEWVAENIIPTLNSTKYSREEARESIRSFAGSDEPVMMSCVNQYDTIYLYKLFGGPDACPFFWMPIDFTSILYAKGIDPEEYINRNGFILDLGIDLTSFREHNALDDAKLMRETYLKLADPMWRNPSVTFR
jgi:hypothetical protein